jgi:hypothetical protein
LLIWGKPYKIKEKAQNRPRRKKKDSFTVKLKNLAKVKRPYTLI